jgi:hypothetical protein
MNTAHDTELEDVAQLKHSDLPWEVKNLDKDHQIINSANGYQVGSRFRTETGDAEFIVQRVMGYDRAVGNLQFAARSYRTALEEQAAINGELVSLLNRALCMTGQTSSESNLAWFKEAKAALAKIASLKGAKS